MKTSAFDRVVERHYPTLYTLAARLTKSPQRASTVTRRAFRHVSDNPAIDRGLLVQVLLLEIAAAAP
jgi:hypothetical protein